MAAQYCDALHKLPLNGYLILKIPSALFYCWKCSQSCLFVFVNANMAVLFRDEHLIYPVVFVCL